MVFGMASSCESDRLDHVVLAVSVAVIGMGTAEHVGWGSFGCRWGGRIRAVDISFQDYQSARLWRAAYCLMCHECCVYEGLLAVVQFGRSGGGVREGRGRLYYFLPHARSAARLPLCLVTARWLVPGGWLLQLLAESGWLRWVQPGGGVSVPGRGCRGAGWATRIGQASVLRMRSCPVGEGRAFCVQLPAAVQDRKSSEPVGASWSRDRLLAQIRNDPRGWDMRAQCPAGSSFRSGRGAARLWVGQGAARRRRLLNFIDRRALYGPPG